MSNRGVENLADHRGGHIFQGLPLLFRQSLEACAERFLQFSPADLLQFLSQGHDGRHLFERVEPAEKHSYLFVHDLLGFLRLARPLPQLLVGHLFQVIDIVEVGVIDLVDAGIEIARNPEIDQEHGFLPSLFQSIPNGLGPQQDLGRTAGADHHVGHLKVARKILVADRVALKLFRQLHRTLKRAIGDHKTTNPAALKITNHQGSHLPCANKHDGLIFQPIEYPLSPIHRHRAYGDHPAPDSRLGAPSLGNRKGAVEQPVEYRSYCAGLLRRSVVILYLPQDLRLSHNHRVEACRNTKEMAHSLAARVGVEMILQSARFFFALLFREKELDFPEGSLLVHGCRNHFHTITRGQDNAFSDSRQRVEAFQGLSKRRPFKRELFPHLDRSGLVVETQAYDLFFWHELLKTACMPARENRSSQKEITEDHGKAQDGQNRGLLAAQTGRDPAVQQGAVKKPCDP